MHTNIRINSPGAMALGIMFAGVTGIVLCEDLLHGAPLTIQHLLTVAALVGTITAGHMCGPHAKSGHWLAALGLAVLFVSGTVYTVISAGSRNAEVQIRKAEAIDATNAERVTISNERKIAVIMLEDESARLARECRSGAGSKCRGIQASIDVYRAAVTGHDAKLERLGPARSANAGYRHAAKVFEVLSGVPAASIEAGLILVMPFLLVLIVEFGTLVWWSVALRSETVIAPTPPADKAPLPVVPDLEASETDRVISWAKAFEAKHGRQPKQAELRAAFDLAKSTAHRIFHTHLRVA